jgi:hypothetical protein
MKLKETACRIWRNFEALANAMDYDPLAELAARVERLERTVTDPGRTRGKSG